MAKDYYEILNVEKTCTLEQIKSSYKKLALVKFLINKEMAPR